jgi:hypothetical protein
MILQERDNKLLRSIAKYAVLSTHQIAHLTFVGVAHTTMMRRLRLLEKEKFISRGVPLDTGTNTWILGYKGREFMNAKPSAVFMNRNTIQHDVLVTEVRLTFETVGLASNWTPEWQMKSEAMGIDRRPGRERVIPDGLMLEPIKGQTKIIAVELERTRKAEKKYDRILSQYMHGTNINFIWYVAKELSIVNAIIRTANKHNFPTSRLWFSLEDQLFAQKDQTPVWRAHEGKWSKLNSLGFDQLKPAQSPTQAVSRQDEEKVVSLTAANILNSNSENQNEEHPGSRPSAPDHSPPTTEEGGSDQELRAESEVSVSSNNNGFKKCG